MDMDMSMSGGMDMGSSGMFAPTNMYIARSYWYIIAAFVVALGLIRWMDHLRLVVGRRALRPCRDSVPSRPTNPFSQVYATGTAMMREVAYPQPFHFTRGLLRYFSPPHLGRCLILIAYWIMLLTMLWANVLLGPTSSMYAYKWEIVAYRAAWVSVTQLPLVYCLSCKINVISLISGISYERLNWLHRWTARTLFLTVIVHWSFFFREWSLSNFVALEFSMMPMVKYGFGAWAVLGWMVFSSFGFLRARSYELFALQHVVSAVVLLWLVHKHVPAYASYNVWLAVSFVAVDHLGRYCRMAYYNLRLRKLFQGRFILGHTISLDILTFNSVRVTIHEVNFQWRPGQHVYISIPSLGLLQSHPFTIANVGKRRASQSVELYIQAQSGFTRSLLQRAQRSSVASQLSKAFLSGPLGNPPSLELYETIVFIATSSGASFNVPLFETAISDGFCRHFYFYWIVREKEQLDWFRERIFLAASAAKAKGAKVTFALFVTGQGQPLAPIEGGRPTTNRDSSNPSPSSSSSSFQGEKLGDLPKDELHLADSEKACWITKETIHGPTNNDSRIDYIIGRPLVRDLINRPVENARGETAVVACGGANFTADIRNHVAWLSDDRAVHKGSGAQGIFLFTETYGW